MAPELQPIEEGRHGNDKWSRPRPERLHKLMRRYRISVALDERFGPNDVNVDVRTDQQHPLLKHEMRIATSPNGGAVLVLTFTAVDLWAAILTGMALVRQSGYVPVAVQASNDVKIPYEAAGTNGAHQRPTARGV